MVNRIKPQGMNRHWELSGDTGCMTGFVQKRRVIAFRSHAFFRVVIQTTVTVSATATMTAKVAARQDSHHARTFELSTDGPMIFVLPDSNC